MPETGSEVEQEPGTVQEAGFAQKGQLPEKVWDGQGVGENLGTVFLESLVELMEIWPCSRAYVDPVDHTWGHVQADLAWQKIVPSQEV